MTDSPVTPARDSQCASCSHWRRQGGLVLEATMRCASLDDAQMDAKARLIVVAMARTLAREGACPTYEALRPTRTATGLLT